MKWSRRFYPLIRTLPTLRKPLIGISKDLYWPSITMKGPLHGERRDCSRSRRKRELTFMRREIKACSGILDCRF